MKSAIIVDIDGTIAHCEHRLHHIKQETKDWQKFYAECVDDEPIQHIVDLVKMYQQRNLRLYFITGRSDKYFSQTNQWLKNQGFQFYSLCMRKEGDFRPDYVIKEEIIKTENLSPSQVELVLEDRNSVVQMWRKLGYVCLQVADGDF